MWEFEGKGKGINLMLYNANLLMTPTIRDSRSYWYGSFHNVYCLDAVSGAVLCVTRLDETYRRVEGAFRRLAGR